MSEFTRSPPKSWSSFLFGCGFLFGLIYRSPRSFRATCELDTDALWESILPRFSPARVSLSLNTVVIGEVDELEEDVG